MRNKLFEESLSRFHRSRNVGRNMVYGLLNRCFALFLPFIVRTVLIYRFGTLYLGMNSLLCSIFQVLNLAELGFGTAVVYSLYKPVAEGDKDTVCAYLGTYRKIYRVIGLVILVAGLALMPFFPYVLRGQAVPEDMDIFVWYLIFLANTVVSYLLFGYKTAIPSALQREDLLSKIDTVVLVGRSVVQMACLLLTDNFYLYLATSLVFTVLRNFLISHLVERCYPQYMGQSQIGTEQHGECGPTTMKGSLQQVRRDGISTSQWEELKQLVGGLALSKFRGASRHMIDSLCITVFVSLTATAIYSNYFLIFTAVLSLSGILDGAMVASVGNSIVMESREKNYRDMRRLNFIFMQFAGWAMICLLCLYQPFVCLWVGPELMLGLTEVVALCLYFYVLEMGVIRWVYHQGAGLWWKARHIVFAEIVANVVLNIVLAKFWGVLGIILATLISLFFINFIGGAWILFKEYFQNGKLKEFFCDHLLYFTVTAVVAIVCWWICEEVSEWIWLWGSNSHLGSTKVLECLVLLIRLLLCSVLAVTGFLLAYHKTVWYCDAKLWLRSRYSLLRKGLKATLIK